jgi:hypothetical protein
MSTKTNDLPKREDLPEVVRTYADIFKKDGKISDTGVLEFSADAYEKTLDGNDKLTMEVIGALQKHNSNVHAAVVLATGELASKWCPKHKDVNEVTAELKVGKDTMGVTYSHQKQVGKPGGAPEDKVTKHGVTRSFYEAHAAGPNRGAVKKVRDFISAHAEAAAAS